MIEGPPIDRMAPDLPESHPKQLCRKHSEQQEDSEPIYSLKVETPRGTLSNYDKLVDSEKRSLSKACIRGDEAVERSENQFKKLNSRSLP